MREELAITPKTSVTAVKQRRRGEVVLILEPVPVWQGALEPAFVAQRLLPEVDEISVPGEEVSGAVNEVGQIDVDGNELVEVVLGGGEDGIDPGEVPETVDGFGVLLPLAF